MTQNSSSALPGVMTLTALASNSGSFTSHTGLGNMSIGIPSSSGRPYTDLLQIYYHDISIDQFRELQLDAQTDPSLVSPAQQRLCDINRRLSKKQAQWLANQVSDFIKGLGYIPADDEI